MPLLRPIHSQPFASLAAVLVAHFGLVSICTAQSGYDRASYAGGMYGAEMMDGDIADSYALPPLNFLLVERATPSGKKRLKPQTATRVRGFAYPLGSLKPTAFPQHSGVGMDGRGYGLGGYGGGGYGGGGYSGGAGGMSMAPGMGGGQSMGSSEEPPHLRIYAYIFDNEQEAGRTKIELVVSASRPRSQPAGSGGGESTGGIDDPFGDAQPAGGSDPFGSSSQANNVDPFGAEGYGSDATAMAGGLPAAPGFERLSTLLAVPGSQTKDSQFDAEELQIVSDTIRQLIWKEDAVQILNDRRREPDQLAQTEQLLKEILTEEYDTQMARQEIEVKRIEHRVQQLRDELVRRAAAKERVIEVQLGRIVLEAQGLLGQ